MSITSCPVKFRYGASAETNKRHNGMCMSMYNNLIIIFFSFQGSRWESHLWPFAFFRSKCDIFCKMQHWISLKIPLVFCFRCIISSKWQLVAWLHARLKLFDIIVSKTCTSFPYFFSRSCWTYWNVYKQMSIKVKLGICVHCRKL